MVSTVPLAVVMSTIMNHFSIDKSSSISDVFRKSRFVLVLVCLIGFGVAYYRFGLTVLNPNNIEWLLEMFEGA